MVAKVLLEDALQAVKRLNEELSQRVEYEYKLISIIEKQNEIIKNCRGIDE